MVRHHFIKMTPSGKSHGLISNRAIACKNNVLSSNNDKSPGQRYVRTYSPIQNRSCDQVKEKYPAGSSSQFLDIDGNEPIALEQPIDLGPKDTSHKIQRHLSLYDLTQQQPESVKLNKPSFSGHSGAKPEFGQTRNNEGPTASTNKRGQFTLPKGSDQLDQPYVVPKFMPSFREILMENRKENPMISITESTPPSMQKWAVEWNSEPKSLSVSELKEDLLREAEENHAGREGKRCNEGRSYNRGRSYSEGRSHREAKSLNEAILLEDETSKAHEGQQSKIVPEPLNPLRGVVFSPPDDIRPGKKGNATLDWLPERYSRLKSISEGLKKEGYSFAEAILKKDPDSAFKDRSDSIPRIFKQRDHVYDEAEQEFYNWFKHKLSKASESSLRSEQKSSSSVKNTFRTTALGYQGPGKTRKASLPQDETNIDQVAEKIPEVHVPSETLAPGEKIHSSGQNSSFYQWLSSRICIPVDRSSWREKPKSETNDVKNETVDPETSMFPWSRYYSRRSAPKTDESGQAPKGKIDLSNELMNKPNSPNVTAFYRKVKSQMTFRKPKLARVRKAKSLVGIRPATAKKAKRKDIEKDYHQQRTPLRKSVPYSQWIVSSELDHVQNLRCAEFKDVSIKAINSANHGNSQQSGSLPPFKHNDEAIKYTKQPAGSWWSAEESTVRNVAGKCPNDVTDSNGFFSISDDAFPMMNDGLQNSRTPSGDTDNKASENNTEEACDTENCVDPSEKVNPLSSMTNHQPSEVNFLSDDSVKPGFSLDPDDPKLNADNIKLKFERDLQNEEEAADADWNRAVGPKNTWPNDNDLIRRLGGGVTKIDSFSLRSHTRPL